MINNKTIRQVVINSKLFPCNGTSYYDVTGSICNFETDLVMPLDACVASFLPVQASGTPTPSSPLPITGHTGLNITKTGANVWNEETLNGYYDRNNSGVYVADNNYLCSKDMVSVVPNTSYFWCINSGETFSGRVLYFDKNGGYLSASESTAPKHSFTTPSGCFFIHFYIYKPSSFIYNKNISINYPSTDTAYHTYAGTTYPVLWTSHGTIYGGSLDVTNGILTTTWKNGNISAEDIINVSSSGGNYIVNIGGPDDISLNSKIMSTDYSYNTDNVDNTIKVVNGKIMINDNRCIDVETASSLLDGLEIYYEVVAPTTTTLTAEDIDTIEGINNIWNDAGTTTIKYPVSGGSCNGIMKFLPIFHPSGKGVKHHGSTF